MQKKSLIYKEFINTLTSYYSIMLNISTKKKKKYTPLFQQIDNKLVASQNKKQKQKKKKKTQNTKTKTKTKTNKNIQDQELLKSKNPKRK